MALWAAAMPLRGASAHGRSSGERGNSALHTQFSRETSEAGGTEVRVTAREAWRIEHFLEAIFPVRQMRRYAWLGGRPAEFPVSRQVTYAVISQQGIQFVLVGYRAEWKATEARTTAVNDLAIYRMEPSGPNQVWRSRPWQASYSALHFHAAKSGWRNVILFQDGSAVEAFALASVFSFYNAPHGLLIRDLTPTFPWLRARERFPLRTIYGQDITFRLDGRGDLFLSASDEPYHPNSSGLIRQTQSWKFNKRRGTFDLSKLGVMTLSSKGSGGN